MPAYWISLKGVPNSPVGVGITAPSWGKAIEMLEAMEIGWHEECERLDVHEIATLNDLKQPAIRSAIQRPITEPGIWFPVFDVETIMNNCVALTSELRFSERFSTFRSQLKTNNIDAMTSVLYSTGQGYSNDDCAFRIFFPPRSSATITCKWEPATQKPSWIREIDIDDYDREPWQPEPVVLWQMCSGKLKSRFDNLVAAQRLL